ncbi:MAG: PTS transporter subunit EIIC [Lachnospiraceae bacterium]|nr:PTS transporter subunit EIIC [Lachnospiraceae bacterium]
MADNRQIAEKVLEAVGGKDNVSFLTHCITRLRFSLKDESIPDDEKIKEIDGVIGVNRTGSQFQVIIGTKVDKVYKEMCEIGGFSNKEESKEEKGSSGTSKKLEFRDIGGIILDYLSGSLTPAIPVMLAGSIAKMFAAIFGPDMLNLIAAESDLYTLLTFVGDAAFYFFPVVVGYTAAKKFGLTPVMGIFFGAILLHPTVISIAEQGGAFSVYGIPTKLQNYSSSLLPIILTVCVASFIEKFFKKVIPDSLRVLGVPVCTTAVTLPLMLCVLAPLGGFLGKYLCTAIMAIGNNFGPLGALIIGATWEFLVMTGMHQVMISSMILLFTESGYDPVVTLGAVSASMAVAGMCLGYFFAAKKKDDKSLAITNTIAAFIGGVTEPGLYGTGLANKKPFIGMMAGGAVGALYAALMGVKAYNMVPVANFLALTAYVGGEGSSNMLHGVISGIIAIIISGVVTFVICREKSDKTAVNIEKKLKKA